ncbi:MAG: DUF424 domain-containing protein [Candidatus Methanomethylophilaceae archaeon]|jgi:hypothetical protein
MIRARIHRHGEERLLAACDEELVGKTFRDEVSKITLTEAFYGTEAISENTLAERMGSVTIMNLFGEGAVAAAIAKGYVLPENVMVVAGIKHAQVVLI